MTFRWGVLQDRLRSGRPGRQHTAADLRRARGRVDHPQHRATRRPHRALRQRTRVQKRSDRLRRTRHDHPGRLPATHRNRPRGSSRREHRRRLLRRHGRPPRGRVVRAPVRRRLLLRSRGRPHRSCRHPAHLGRRRTRSHHRPTTTRRNHRTPRCCTPLGPHASATAVARVGVPRVPERRSAARVHCSRHRPPRTRSPDGAWPSEELRASRSARWRAPGLLIVPGA